MNLSLDQFMRGLERSVRELPSVLASWESLDPELLDGYSDQLGWMLEARLEAEAMAAKAGRSAEISERLARVNSSLFAIREPLGSLMGIHPGMIVSSTVADVVRATVDCTVDEPREVALPPAVFGLGLRSPGFTVQSSATSHGRGSRLLDLDDEAANDNAYAAYALAS